MELPRIGMDFDHALLEVSATLRPDRMRPKDRERIEAFMEMVRSFFPEIVIDLYYTLSETPDTEKPFMREALERETVIGVMDAEQHQAFQAFSRSSGMRTLLYFALPVVVHRDFAQQRLAADFSVFIALRSPREHAFDLNRFKILVSLLMWLEVGIFLAIDREFLRNFALQSLSSIPIGYLMIADFELSIGNERARELLGVAVPVNDPAPSSIEALFPAEVAPRVKAAIAAMYAQNLKHFELSFRVEAAGASRLLKAILTPVRLLDAEEIGLDDETVKYRFSHTLGMALVDVTDEVLLEQLATEIKYAKKAQQRLLPNLEHVFGPFVIAATLVPANEVGGDSYDIIQDAGGRYWFAVTDVSGHGLDSAFVATFMKGSFHSLLNRGLEVVPLLEAQDRIMRLIKDWSFMTCTVVLVDPATGLTHFSSAGHPPALLYRRETDEVEELEIISRPLGISLGDEIPFTTLERQLAPGDIFLLYTDGVAERMNKNDEAFGYERLRELVKTAAGQGPHALIDALAAALEAFSEGIALSDDWTALACQWLGE